MWGEVTTEHTEDTERGSQELAEKTEVGFWPDTSSKSGIALGASFAHRCGPRRARRERCTPHVIVLPVGHHVRHSFSDGLSPAACRAGAGRRRIRRLIRAMGSPATLGSIS